MHCQRRWLLVKRTELNMRNRVTVMATGRRHEWQVRYWCPTCREWQDYAEPVWGVTVDVASVQAVVRQCERALSHSHARTA